MPTGFNLVTHPWLTVQTASGIEEMGLYALFTQSKEIRDLVEEAKTRHALYLFLTALAHEASFQQLGRPLAVSDLPLRSDADVLRGWCLEYLRTPEATEAFSDDRKFLHVPFPDFLKPTPSASEPPISPPPPADQEERGISPDNHKCTDSPELSVPSLDTPSQRFKDFLTLQAFYPTGPDSGSSRYGGQYFGILLGADLMSSIWLNLKWMCAIEDSDDVMRTKDIEKKTGRAAWVYPPDAEGIKNRTETTVGSLTPLFRFVDRTPHHWEWAPCIPVWDVSPGSGIIIQKAPGLKMEREYPDRLSSSVSWVNKPWRWKNLFEKVENIKSKIQRKAEEKRMFSVRMITVASSDTNTKVRHATLEKTYHFSGHPKEVGYIKTALSKSEDLVKAVEVGLKKLPPLIRSATISTVGRILEDSWELLYQPADAEESPVSEWENYNLQRFTALLSGIAAKSKEEFASVNATSQKIHQILKT